MHESTILNYHSIVLSRLQLKRPYRMLQWILVYCFYNSFCVKGTIVISPPSIASVCFGGYLDITCTTNGTFLRWYITRPDVDNDASTRSFTRALSSFGLVSGVAPLTINNTTFDFSRISPQGILPLVSRLTISPVSEIINGTQVKCQDVITNSNSSTTIVNIVGGDINLDHEVEISYSEQFHRDNFTIILNFSYYDEIPLVSFNVFITSPLSEVMRGKLHAPVTITLLYNVHYNVSVVASLCGQAIAESSRSIGLFHDSCETPSTYSREFLMIMGYTIPAREGTNITFNCSSGLELVGPNTSTCMGNGNWEPDLKEVECKAAVNVTSVTLSQEESDLKPSVDTALVISLPVIISVIIIGAIVAVILLIRKEMKKYPIRKQYVDREIERCSIPNSGDQTQLGSTLVYADLGPSLFKQLAPATSAIDLDDSHVEYAKINHAECKPPHTMSEQKTEAGEVPSVNLDTLLILIKAQVTPIWRKFGDAVKIDKNVLDSFAKNCSSEDCTVETLDYWLRNRTKRPTWSDVAQALNAIGLPQLAFEINKISTTGSLPINGNFNTEDFSQLNIVPIVEKPPPIPPKMDKQGQLPSIATERSFCNDISVPVLPPKPYINTMPPKAPTIPPRPPKP